MSPTPIILAALASGCRLVSSQGDLELAERREVLEFHLNWMEIVHCDSANDESTDAKFQDLALRMARFIVSHEPSRP